MKENQTISAEALETQRAYMSAVARKLYRTQRYHIVTLGCQMNVRDSETLAGTLEAMGYQRAESREQADLVLYNTCCVRENAENRALGNVIWLKELKKLKPRLLICVCGCMMQEPGVAENLQRQYPFIDLIFGTHNAHRFPELLYRVLTEEKPVVEVLETDGAIAEGLPVRRGSANMAYITVMYGCNNFCSYCIVPYVRGRERSREASKILEEAKILQDSGVKEIMLLGQNVNSYGGGGGAFAELLYQLDRLGIPRLRFMTSHPKDISEELIASFAELPSLMPQLHLPVQAGNDRILSLMNRRYTRERYLSLVERLRKARPDIALTSDIIVGFPGETYDEFRDTVSLVQAARFDAAFTFIFSPRKGTKAESLPDLTDAEEKSRRIQILIHEQQRISREILEEQVGKTETVLVETVSARDEGGVCGKTPRGHMVNFRGGEALIGEFVKVAIRSAGRNTLRGEILS